MTTSAGHRAAAPWRADFLAHVEKMEGGPAFALSTVHAVEPSSSSPTVCPAPTTAVQPRVRYCIFRGMWASLPPNPRNPAPRNPALYESELLTITTDMRMRKGPEIVASAPDAQATADRTSSGGGGPVEAVFWVPATMTQWRIQGSAYILGPDMDGEGAGAQGVRAALLPRMRRRQMETPDESWSWAREVTVHFGDLSPGMRGSFKNPPPGRPSSEAPADPRLRLGQTVDDVEDEVARANFRVVVIRPDVVERVDLTEPEKARRWKHSFVGGDAGTGWAVEEEWP